MQPVDLNKVFDAKLSKKDFDRLSDFIYTNYGIKMPPAKHIMLQSRLQKRLRALNMTDFKEYVEFVFSKEGREEIIHMMDVVSTNKTDFFRESQHFDLLKDFILPQLYTNKQRFLKVWSAGCSSGEEPYTLAMVLSDFEEQNAGFDFSITATDISTIVLEKAVMAIYPEDRVNIVPLHMKKKYLLKSKDRDQKTVRIAPQLRHKITFQRLNLMDAAYGMPENYDIIFCRNVLIYFDRETQERVINKLCRHLKKDGFFFLGHSESITGINVPLHQVKPTVYKKI